MLKFSKIFAIGNRLVIFAPFPSRSTQVVTKVRTARRATGVSVSIGCNPLLSTYLTAATLLREVVPGIDTCPVRCPWEAITCTFNYQIDLIDDAEH